MAQKSPAALVVDVRSATGHDTDTQVTDTQITVELDKEYRRVRRWLSSFVPDLYQTQGASTAVTGSSGATLVKPSGFERLIRIEKEEAQGAWRPLTLRPGLVRGYGQSRSVAGNYRIVYVSAPVDGYLFYDVPEGCEDLLVMAVAAWVKVRHEEDPTYYMQRYTQMQSEFRSQLAQRYGQHLRGGLVDRRFTSEISFYEQGANFVLV